MSADLDEDEELGSASHDLSLVLLRQTPSCSAALFSKSLVYFVIMFVSTLSFFVIFVPLSVLCDRLITHPRFDI